MLETSASGAPWVTNIRENSLVGTPSVRTLFGIDGRESGVSPSGGRVCYKSCDVFVQPAFSWLEIAKGMAWALSSCSKTCLLYKLSSILSITILTVVLSFWYTVSKKLLCKQTIADLIQPTCLLVSEERRVRDRSGKAKN